MTRISALSDMLYSIVFRGARNVEQHGDAMDELSIEDLCDMLMSSKGEASGMAIATQVLSRYERLNEAGKAAFFDYLAHSLDPDPDVVAAAASDYATNRTSASMENLFRAVEPKRQELFRRLNLAPDGTRRLVAMRLDVLNGLYGHPNWKRIDYDFQHLLASWFNRGFLIMQPIDWDTSATILEKIIAYEAVHEIDSWESLALRLKPEDRRCFAFFHPSMPDEPLIFVEVALTRDIATSIQDVLKEEREIVPEEEATTAVFYSISNCQAGLRGVSFGAFLIKQVARDLSRELPTLSQFVTLSPVPGFMRWLSMQEGSDVIDIQALLAGEDWVGDEEDRKVLGDRLLPLAAKYFLQAKRADDQPVDPVARFHLGNGAELAQINWLADQSAKGLRQSASLMVNYRYDLESIEANHEAYASERLVAASKSVQQLLPSTKEQRKSAA